MLFGQQKTAAAAVFLRKSSERWRYAKNRANHCLVKMLEDAATVVSTRQIQERAHEVPVLFIH